MNKNYHIVMIKLNNIKNILEDYKNLNQFLVLKHMKCKLKWNQKIKRLKN